MRHVKGILIALVVAVVGIFLLSLLMSQQLVLQKEVVVNANVDSVFTYLSNHNNLTQWIGDLKGIETEDKGDGRMIFEGRDQGLYAIESNIATNAKGVEFTYFKGEDVKAVFIYQARGADGQTVVSAVQHWDVGLNPFTKLLAYKTKDKSEEALENDLIALKMQLEQSLKK